MQNGCLAPLIPKLDLTPWGSESAFPLSRHTQHCSGGLWPSVKEAWSSHTRRLAWKNATPAGVGAAGSAGAAPPPSCPYASCAMKTCFSSSPRKVSSRRWRCSTESSDVGDGEGGLGAGAGLRRGWRHRAKGGGLVLLQGEGEEGQSCQVQDWAQGFLVSPSWGGEGCMGRPAGHRPGLAKKTHFDLTIGDPGKTGVEPPTGRPPPIWFPGFTFSLGGVGALAMGTNLSVGFGPGWLRPSFPFKVAFLATTSSAPREGVPKLSIPTPRQPPQLPEESSQELQAF